MPSASLGSPTSSIPIRPKRSAISPRCSTRACRSSMATSLMLTTTAMATIPTRLVPARQPTSRSSRSTRPRSRSSSTGWQPPGSTRATRAPSPVGCDGVNVPCTYVDPVTGLRSVGELTTNLDSLLLTQRGNTTPFLVHADDAPTLYISGNPSPTAPVTRTLEKDIAALTFTNPLFGKNNRIDQLAQFLADQSEMQLLHMVTPSSARTPTFTVFGNPDYFFQTTRGTLPLAPVDCSANPQLCVVQNNAFAWNHGDVQE